MAGLKNPQPHEEGSTRRNILIGGFAAAALAPTLVNDAVAARTHAGLRAAHRTPRRIQTANMITTRDGTEIYYKDWGHGRPILFSHGWPLNADIWDDQMMFMSARGFRCVAFDRRGHGRSSQPWDGNDYDSFAEDLSALIESLDLRGAILVGHSAGTGDIARYIGRHGTANLSGTVLVSAIPPLMLKTPANPNGVPIALFDRIRAGVADNRAQFYRDLGDGPFFGANRPGAIVSQGIRDAFWLWSMQCGLRAAYEGIKAFSETDFTQDLTRFDVPTLIIHGGDDQNVPIAATAFRSAKLIRNANLKVYAGAPHGLTVTHREKFNNDLLDFAQGLA
jgi:non-heme chloroperoxidase